MRAALVALLLCAPALAADWTKPHPHRGVLKPFSSSPPAIALSAAEKEKLATGAPVFRQTTDEGATSGRGAAVFRVAAPPAVVWSVIGDFAKYPQWIDELEETKVYAVSGPKDGVQTIDVYMKVAKMGVSVEYFVHHVYDHARHVGTWTLDYAKESDVDDSVGFWRVTPYEGGGSLVEYSVDLKTKGWVPGFIKDLLTSSGLKAATRWVKVQAEARAGK